MDDIKTRLDAILSRHTNIPDDRDPFVAISYEVATSLIERRHWGKYNLEMASTPGRGWLLSHAGRHFWVRVYDAEASEPAVKILVRQPINGKWWIS